MMPAELLTAPAATVASGSAWLVRWTSRLEPREGGRLLARGREFACELGGGHASRETTTAVHGPLVGLVEGFVDDPADLARELAVSPRSAAELVLLAYARLGAAAIHRTRGVNARVIGDIESGTLLAARDPLGNQPLFYAVLPGGVAVSPSIDALLADPQVARTLNRPALADHLAGRWPDKTETYFEHVRRVPPGHLLTWSQGAGASVARYWDPYPLDKPIEWLDESETNFDACLERAVTRCLVGRTGIFLSGGFDSVSVAAVATDVSRRRGLAVPHALSLGFPQGEADEQVIQRGVAAALDLPFDMLPFFEAAGGRPLLEQAMEMCRSFPAPMLHTWNPVYAALVARGRAHGVDVVLTGGGGDEWLSISPMLAADYILAGDLRGLWRFLAMWRRSYPFTWPGLVKSGVWRFGLRPVGSHLLNSIAPGWWGARRTRRVVAATPAWVAPDPALRRTVDARTAGSITLASPPGGNFYAYAVRASLDHALVSAELEESHLFGQRHGVRMMRPYYDVDLVELLYRTRPDVLARGGRAKGLVRDSVARRFPGFGFEAHKKRAATTFYRSILMAELPKMWAERGGVPSLARLGIADAAQAKALMADASQKGLNTRLYRLWDLFNLDTWVHAHS
jgi:asparagine synthase (glutamine-hydrolysing)